MCKRCPRKGVSTEIFLISSFILSFKHMQDNTDATRISRMSKITGKCYMALLNFDRNHVNIKLAGFCPVTNYAFFLCQVCFMLSINQVIVSNNTVYEILALLSCNMLCYLFFHIANKAKILVKSLKSLIWLETFSSNFSSLLKGPLIHSCFSIKVNSLFSFFSWCLFYFYNVIFAVMKQTLFEKKNPKPPPPKTPPQSFLLLPAIKLLHWMWGKADIKVLHGWNHVFVHFTFIRMEKLQKKYMGFQFYCSPFDFVFEFFIINSTSLL